MFRKITSNRDPGKTLGSELKKEFGIYFQRAGQKGRGLMIRYPRQVFIIMVVAIFFSGILAFTVMRSGQPPDQVTKAAYPQQAVSGFGQIISTVNALQALWGIQQQINSLLKKESLTHLDSLTLNHALAKMDSLQIFIKKARPKAIPQLPEQRPKTNANEE